MSAKREVIAPDLPALQLTKTFGWQASPAIRGGDFIFVSGLMAIDPKTGVAAPGTVMSELSLVLEALKALLEGAGSSMSKVLKVNILLYSMLEFPNVDVVYRSFFPEDPPARTISGARVPKGFKVVLECTALA